MPPPPVSFTQRVYSFCCKKVSHERERRRILTLTRTVPRLPICCRLWIIEQLFHWFCCPTKDIPSRRRREETATTTSSPTAIATTSNTSSARKFAAWRLSGVPTQPSSELNVRDTAHRRIFSARRVYIWFQWVQQWSCLYFYQFGHVGHCRKLLNCAVARYVFLAYFFAQFFFKFLVLKLF